MPRALRVIADAVRVDADIKRLERVVNADGERVLARRELFCQVINMRRGKRVVFAREFTVHPHLRLPMGPLQREQHALVRAMTRGSPRCGDNTPGPHNAARAGANGILN